MATVAERPAASHLSLTRATGACGAYVSGIDLSADLDDATIKDISRALHDYGVIVFRGQDITPVQQIAFAARFGELHVHPLVPSLPGHPEIMLLRNENVRAGSAKKVIRWHSDSTWEKKPIRATLLRAVTLPSFGGDTVWANQYAAYDALSEPMKEFLGGLHAVHDAAVQGRLEHLKSDNADWELKTSIHPVVITDPITGRKALFVNPGYTTHIVELSRAESDLLLPWLFDHQTKEEFCFRLAWEPGTIAFWCNTVTQHLAIRDYDELRVMNRVAILADSAPE